MILTKLRNVDGYDDMSRQQLESIFTTPSLPKPTTKPTLKPKKRTPTPAPKSKKPTSISINLKKVKWHKNRVLAENTWYEQYDGLINHIPKSVKKSANNVKEKITKIFKTKIDSNIPNDYKKKRIAGAFDDKYIECKGERDE